jgi:hypothetical protein
MTRITSLSQRLLLLQQPIEWDIVTALGSEVDAKKHSATFAHHVFFAFEAPLARLPGALLGVL